MPVPRPPARTPHATLRVHEEGASEVVGSVLTVAITVLLMGAVFVLFLRVPPPADTVHAALDIEVAPGAGGWNTGDERVVVTHKGGEPLEAAATRIHIELAGQQVRIEGAALGLPNDRLVIGQQWTSPAYTIAAGAPVQVAVAAGTRVISSGAVSVVEAASAAVTLAVPGAPAGLAAASGDGQLTLAWTAPANDGGSAITSYNVYRGTASGSLALLASGGCTNLGAVLACTDTGLTNGQTYFYQVSAANAQGEGARSSEASGMPAATAPGAPTGATAVHGPGNGKVSLDWTAPANNGGSAITSYKVYRGTTSGNLALLTSGGCATLGAVLSCADGTANAGTTYYYQVSAVNAAGEGARSNETSAVG